jgi:ABC-type Fe3+-hydroxamate transport system substrate-binding protein
MTEPAPVDDLGTAYLGIRPAARVVSLVPSLTEAVAATVPGALVGATDWCTHPTGLDVPRVRGTKNPDLVRIQRLRPDVVIANKEENRLLDVERLRSAGIRVWVTDIRTVSGALASMRRLLAGLGWGEAHWLETAIEQWGGPPAPVTRTVVVPIWRDPWMVVGGDTFTSDLLRHLGWENRYAAHGDRYPHVDLADLDAVGADVILLPDEPYAFTESDGPEAFVRTPTELVSGRLITWYGPSLLEAHRSYWHL